MATIDKQALIDHWRLQPMTSENVLFTQSYVAAQTGTDNRPCGTAIIAMLTSDADSISDMHRLPIDEIWHFYLGDPVELLLLHPDGRDELVVLGQDVLAGEHVQFVAPAHAWFGARVRPGGQLAVFGNTLAPGFVQDDFEAADRDQLIARWPHREALIRAMTR